jgi:hypothetical protein
MKKRDAWRRQTILSVVILLLLLIPAAESEANSVDAIVLIDTSGSMFSYFDDTREYLIERILTEQLTIGDSFHLLSFAGEPDYEISRKMKGLEEIKAVIARLMLLQPLGIHTDLVSAFKALYDYVSDLPLESRKEIFILTDGIHDPPPGSPYPVSAGNSSDVAEIAASMRRNGWNVHIIQFPTGEELADSGITAGESAVTAGTSSDGAGASDGTSDGTSGSNLLPVISQELNNEIVPYTPDENGFAHKATGQLELVFPNSLGTVGDNFVFQLTVISHLNEPSSISIDDVLINGEAALEKSLSTGVKAGEKQRLKLDLSLPESIEDGEQLIDLEIVLADSGRAFPRRVQLDAHVLRSAGRNGSLNGYLRYLVYGLAALVVLLIIIWIVRRSFGPGADIQPVHEKERITPYGLKQKDKEETALIASDDTLSESALLLADFGSSRDKNAAAEELMAFSREHKKTLPPGSSGSSSIAGRSSGLYSLKEIQEARAAGKIAIEMRVQEQNRLIGKRNIKWLKDGESLRVGGSSSSPFIIFLYPVPAVIGTIRRSGELFTFTPEDPSRFTMKEKLQTGSLDTPITYKLSENVSISFKFHIWVSPLENINRFLHVIDTPGLPKEEQA